MQECNCIVWKDNNPLNQLAKQTDILPNATYSKPRETALDYAKKTSTVSRLTLRDDRRSESLSGEIPLTKIVLQSNNTPSDACILHKSVVPAYIISASSLSSSPSLCQSTSLSNSSALLCTSAKPDTSSTYPFSLIARFTNSQP